jgi:hypothetical protein
LEGVFQEQPALVLHILEETVFADGLSSTNQDGSDRPALLAHCAWQVMLFLLLFLAASALLLGALLALTDLLEAGFKFFVLVFVAATRQFISKVHFSFIAGL